MATMTLRIDDHDSELIKKFAQIHNLSISDFARQAMLGKIEDEYDLKELREAIATDDGTRFSMDEVHDELGL
ncbi:type II toxin-antitoxin system RelB family antitoxin [Eupransor demetentiae]|uniref:CopG family transcriptional regulator n=1 Tax=Eupransor demetentiae TaxID=3109584 RepID=A0ABM9N5L5_9LACO|nr:hypothetical protein R54876_GBNLAHCA_01060 [Lactobacillaceae bacterium LMG 33000]